MPLYARLTSRTFFYTLFFTIPPLDYFTSHHYAIYHVRGASMAPSLSPDYHATNIGDWVLFRKNIRLSWTDSKDGTPYSRTDLQRGMVVSFRSPISGLRAIKRVVALEGDQVTPFRRKRDGGPFGLDPIEEETVTVPFGHVWVEGDQVEREKTLDSNDYGPISKSLIEGVAVRILSPAARRGAVDLNGAWERRCRGRIKRWAGPYEIPEAWELV